MSETKPDESEILFPDRQIPVGDELVTVHEFTFTESMRASVIAAPIIRELAELFIGEAGEQAGYEDMAEIFSKHEERYLELVAIATGLPVERIRTMPGQEGDELSLMFWNVNKGFFTRRLAMRAMQKRRRRPSAEASASPSSPSH